MVISIGVYALIPFDGFAAEVCCPASLLLPVIAGLSYELIRFAAKHAARLLATLTAPACGSSGSRRSRPPTTSSPSPSTPWKAPWRWRKRRAANSW